MIGALLGCVFFSGCETIETEASEAIRVEGTLFYPDGVGQIYVVLAGAEIVGAGGTDCTFVVESGGRLEAHSGKGNTYRVKEGGFFKGFAHPAENCTVEYSSQCTVELIESGPGTSFTMVN